MARHFDVLLQRGATHNASRSEDKCFIAESTLGLLQHLCNLITIFQLMS
jgi:hypothetical protein